MQIGGIGKPCSKCGERDMSAIIAGWKCQCEREQKTLLDFDKIKTKEELKLQIEFNQKICELVQAIKEKSKNKNMLL